MTLVPGRVSVVIPVFDNVAHVAEAVRSALDQTHPDVEVVAVDDGSNDGSADVLASFGSAIVVVRQPNLGVSAARNRGVAASSGELLAFLDADDRLPPDRLALAVSLLRRRPDLDAVVGRVDEVVEAGPDTDGLRAPRRGVAARLPGTLTVRRRAFDRVGGFDPDRHGSEAIDWFARADDAGLAIGRLDAVVLIRRLHGANASLTDPEALQRQYLDVVVRRVEARRSRP